MMTIMSEKKTKFLKEVLDYGCAVLVGPLLGKNELSSIPTDAPLFLIDGGVEAAFKLGISPSRSIFTVGDGDSSDFDHDLKFEVDKDFSDLKGCLDLVPHEVNKIKLFGFLDGRKDHELINFGEISQFLKTKKSKSKAYFSKNLMALSSGIWKITSDKGVFSLMSLERGTISITGNIKYPVNSPKLITPLSSQYLSNFTEGEFTISVTEPIYLFADGISLRAE